MYTARYIALLCLILGHLTLRGQQALPSTYSGSSQLNFVRSYAPKMAIGTPDSLPGRTLRQLHEVTHYYDGLGRPLQIVARKGSLVTGDSARDLVTASLYDSAGRPATTYLPFAANSAGGNSAISNGLFKLNPFEQQVSFYNTLLTGQTGETNVGPGSLNWAYSLAHYEPSPLHRIEQTLAPGASWVGAGRGVRTIEAVNVPGDSVKMFQVTDVSSNWGTYAATGTYAAGALFKTITIDEAGQVRIQFHNKNGQMILEKRQLTAAVDTGQGSGHHGWQCVYHLYDRMERLRAVVQPAGVQQLNGNGWDFTALSGAILDQQCYRFEYDNRGLQIRKMAPGGAWENFVYDYKQRLVMRQTRLMAAAASLQWEYTTYDDLGRPVATGQLTSASSVYAQNANATEYNQPFPVLSNYTYEEHTQHHYDDYTGLPGGLPTSATNGTHETAAFTTSYNTHPEYAEPWGQASTVFGQLTWTKTRVLGTSDFIYTIHFYDEKGRAIQLITQYPTGATTRESTQYNFSGQPIRGCVLHEKTGANAYTIPILALYTYDDLGRVTKLERKFSGRDYQRIFELQYDALGRVKNRDLAQAPEQTAAAAPLFVQQQEYNIRGWSLGLNRSYTQDTVISSDTYWGYDLAYDNGQRTVGGINAPYTANNYDGNFAGITWKSGGDSRVRRYDVSYDATGRFIAADFNQFSSTGFSKTAKIDFSVDGITYDHNGNLLTMNQRGWKPSGSQCIDSMTYSYMPYSNRLASILDYVNDTATILSDFRSSAAYMTSLGGTKTTAATDYTYDVQGNLASDKNKDLQAVSYNHLNLPTHISIPGKGTIAYVYDAKGIRLKKIVTDSTGAGVTVKTTLYLDAFTYESQVSTPAQPTDRTEVLTLIAHEEGRIRFNDSIPAATWDWYLKDHLGNIRMVMAVENKIDVYPTLSMEGASGSPEAVNQATYYTDYYGNPFNVVTERVPRPGAMGDTTTNGHYVDLQQRASWAIGGHKLMRVMAGDKIHAAVDYFYTEPDYTAYNSWTNPYPYFITSLAFNIFASQLWTDAFKIQLAGPINALNGNSDFLSLITTPPQTSGSNEAPKAYLNIVFFDEQFRFDPAGSVSFPVAYQPGTVGTIDKRGLSAIPVKRNGFVLVYYTNETNDIVYFDNFKVSHERGYLLDEYHYYPFGLTMAGISSAALRESTLPINKKRYNGGSEIQQREMATASLEWYMTDLRAYDAQIGRWNGMDTKPVYHESPYAAMQNNPIRYIDPRGDTIRIAGDIYAQFVIGLNMQKMSKSEEGRKGLETLRNSKNTFTFRLGERSKFEPSKINHAYQKQMVEMGRMSPDQFTGGSGGTITLNPNGGPINTTKGIEFRPETDLAHEIGHALTANTGDTRGTEQAGRLDEGEFQASHYENKVRAGQGLPLRATYGGTMSYNPETGQYTYEGGGTSLLFRRRYSVYVPGYDYIKEHAPKK